MASSALLLAKRALVSVLLALGCAYKLTFSITRGWTRARVRASLHAELRARSAPKDYYLNGVTTGQSLFNCR